MCPSTPPINEKPKTSRNKIIPASPSEEEYGQEYYRIDEDQGEVFTNDDPIALFEDWLQLARKHELNDPNAMSLATVDRAGMPDVRIVLLKDINERGLSFFTNIESAKGQNLNHHPMAALCFHWKSIRRQVRFRGNVEKVSDEEANEYFATRARGAQIGAWASAQSRPIAHEGQLQEDVAAHEAQFKGQDIKRPDHWSGFRIIPTQIEFWVNKPYRLHDRLQFIKRNDQKQKDKADWAQKRLYP